MAPSLIADGLTAWADERRPEGVTWHRPSGNYRIRLGKDELIYFYQAQDWVFAIFKTLQDSEVAQLRGGLSNPASVRATKKYWGCRVHSRADGSTVVKLLERRIAAGTW